MSKHRLDESKSKAAAKDNNQQNEQNQRRAHVVTKFSSNTSHFVMHLLDQSTC